MDEQRMPGLYLMCAITMFFIMSCITFVTYGVKKNEQQMLDRWATPITQEQINESWQKYEQRQAIRKQTETIGEQRDKYPGN